MLRTLILSVWGAGVALGVLYVMLKPPSAEAMDAAKAEKMMEKPNIFTEPALLVSPVLHDTQVKGYLFARVVMELKAKALKGVNVPAEMILQDAYNEFLIGNQTFVFPDVKSFDLMAFRMGMEKILVKTLGEGKVDSVVVQDVNFIPARNVRRPGKLRTVDVQDPEVEEVEPKKKDKKKKDKKK